MHAVPPVVEDFGQDIASIARIDAVPTILQVICRVTGMGFAAVARVTEDRWIACEVHDEIEFGLRPGRELKVETTICNEIRGSGQAVVIDHVTRDEKFREHPTPSMYGFESYISVPIRRRNGEFFGTLCAIDPRPARLRTPEVIGMFELFAALIGRQLESQDRLAQSEADLVDERQLAELREQFIAVLGHDLRNPLASIDAGVNLLRRTPLDDKAVATVDLIQKSVQRMARLIDNILDFARGRLGGGLIVERTAVPIRPVLAQVIEEMRLAVPDRTIEEEFAVTEPVNGDGARIAQLLSNLLANALSHGTPGTPVRVGARGGANAFELFVANSGDPIPADTIGRLFQPFFRASAPTEIKGLGLGLFISQEIARAHGGMLTVHSDERETRFTFRMPAE
ncbi:MAG TPA: GAF domain-containing sensor histidine kinase [Xanthobacteraceae bacterium]|nr:GAF domain-containing sensor histidine kinase [Xanthobacteraceae bacterium]